MERAHDRIVNGLLKADIGLLTPEQVSARLSQDLLIQVDPTRATANDLWPCIWFLASVLERQFTGRVYIDAGLNAALPAPIPLGPRCRFVSAADSQSAAMMIVIGACDARPTSGIVIAGDTRGNAIAYGSPLRTTNPAHPIGCCALAGYLGFAALAQAVGIPEYHADYRKPVLTLPFHPPTRGVPSQCSVLGTGQLGQAFLALGYFLADGNSLAVQLVDKDEFEAENQRTQILLSEESMPWLGKPKVAYLSDICRSWAWEVLPEHTEIQWGWRASRGGLAFLGFDNMDARRIGVEGGFEWIVEAGVGTDFLRPHISWHSLPPDRELAKTVFADGHGVSWSDSAFGRSLGETAASCGRVVFENVDAAAPSLGLAAISFAWSELLQYVSGNRTPIGGGAYLWSPLLPVVRE